MNIQQLYNKLQNTGTGRERLERMQYARIDTIFWEIKT